LVQAQVGRGCDAARPPAGNQTRLALGQQLGMQPQWVAAYFKIAALLSPAALCANPAH
jgi:hypothetical protein